MWEKKKKNLVARLHKNVGGGPSHPMTPKCPKNISFCPKENKEKDTKQRYNERLTTLEENKGRLTIALPKRKNKEQCEKKKFNSQSMWIRVSSVVGDPVSTRFLFWLISQLVGEDILLELELRDLSAEQEKVLD